MCLIRECIVILVVTYQCSYEMSLFQSKETGRDQELRSYKRIHWCNLWESKLRGKTPTGDIELNIAISRDNLGFLFDICGK
ncbi:Hypothetical predicted protein [Octopus vulgaris]|uniref:Uncharacterized protein n=1 Tax=Octopus vulgaris TaxID=6645 RepID=A0AA36AHN1_OCTVU|nr:Hypothetical predicted protein [Octopus vulgaris]